MIDYSQHGCGTLHANQATRPIWCAGPSFSAVSPLYLVSFLIPQISARPPLLEPVGHQPGRRAEPESVFLLTKEKARMRSEEMFSYLQPDR